MEELMAALATYDWGGDRGALMPIDARAAEATVDKEKREALEQALLGVLQSDAPLPAKEHVCRQLALIGTSKSVPVLAAMLADAELSDRARFALEAVPDASADDALRAALDSSDGIIRVGIVNTLGERRDKKAVPAIEKMRDSGDAVLSNAVDAALRKIAAAG